MHERPWLFYSPARSSHHYAIGDCYRGVMIVMSRHRLPSHRRNHLARGVEPRAHSNPPRSHHQFAPRLRNQRETHFHVSERTSTLTRTPASSRCRLVAAARASPFLFLLRLRRITPPLTVGSNTMRFACAARRFDKEIVADEHGATHANEHQVAVHSASLACRRNTVSEMKTCKHPDSLHSRGPAQSG